MLKSFSEVLLRPSSRDRVASRRRRQRRLFYLWAAPLWAAASAVGAVGVAVWP